MANPEMDRKRRAAQKIKAMTDELNEPEWKDLLGIRTNLLIEYGIEVKKALDYLKSVHPEYDPKNEGIGSPWHE